MTREGEAKAKKEKRAPTTTSKPTASAAAAATDHSLSHRPVAAHSMNRALLITGKPGTGKSTLVSKLVRSLKEQGIAVQGFWTKEVRAGPNRIGFDVVTLDGKVKQPANNNNNKKRRMRWKEEAEKEEEVEKEKEVEKEVEKDSAISVRTRTHISWLTLNI